MPTHKGPPAAHSPSPPRPPQVIVPKDAAVMRWLRDAAARIKIFGTLANAADPGQSHATGITICNNRFGRPMGATVGAELLALAGRAREAGEADAAAMLAAMAGQLGVREPEPEPAAGPKPAPVRAS